ncbi:MAG: VWA domain-containing protein [Chloroflexota bacterium]|nr:VWA domain-containing protein [Chloroflexota bacterium]
MTPFDGLSLRLLAPLGLTALIAIPIVLLLHMRRTTPRELPVPTLRFWLLAVREEAERTRWRRPPITPLLLLHLLIVAAIGFGLTRPATSEVFAGLATRSEPRHTILLIDGSTSMAATDSADGTRFAAAKETASSELEDMREGDVATVLLLGTSLTTFAASDAGGFARLRGQIAGLDQPGGRADLDAALDLAHDLLLPGLENNVVVITDGSLTADPSVVADLEAPIRLVQLGGADGAERPNIAITELAARAAPDNPSQRQIYVRIANFGPADVTALALLRADDLEIARQNVTLPFGGGTVDLLWPVPDGTVEVSVEIPVPDLLQADNDASLILRQDADLALNILLVSDLPGDLLRALQVLPGAQVTVEPTDTALLREGGGGFDLVVFERFTPAPSELPAVPLLFVQPPSNGVLFPTRGVMPAPVVSQIRVDDSLVSGVDFGGVSFGETPVYVLDGNQTEIIGAENGPLLFAGEVRDQPMVALAFDVNTSNIGKRTAFPILIANIAGRLARGPLPPSVALGDPLTYQPRSNAAAVRVVSPDGEISQLTLASDGRLSEDDVGSAEQDRLSEVSFTATGQPGTYSLAELDEAGAELGGGRFVVNAGHRAESNLLPNPELPITLAGAEASGGLATAGTPLTDLWPLLAAAGLALLLIEWVVTLGPRRRRGRARGHSSLNPKGES